MFDDVKKLPFLKFFNKQEDIENKTSTSDSFAAPNNTDGADVDVVDSNYPLRKIYGLTWGADGDVNDAELINQYRNVAANHEVDRAITEITDECIVFEDSKDTISVDLSGTNFSEAVQVKMREALTEVLHVYDFENKGWNKFRQWYIDGRQYHHIMLKEDNKKGIEEIRELDPRKTKKIREVIKTKNPSGIETVSDIREFFVYTQDASDITNSGKTTGGSAYKIKIPKQAIIYTHSGITGTDDRILSNLHKAVKNANQLRMVEDCAVIYRLARAPERRVFYVDVGKMPNTKAKQHMRNIMDSFNNKVVYNSATGSTQTKNDVNSVMEDYWLPRREGSKGTEITTLPGAQSLGDIDDIEYFNTKLYESLGVPQSRFSSDSQANFGRGSEITREELRFAKSNGRLQRSWQDTFLLPLRVQSILTKIITDDDWKENLSHINIVYNKDSYFEQQKHLEILNLRVESLAGIEPYIGKFISNETVRKTILDQTDDEIKKEDEMIAKEKTNTQYKTEEE
jgi:hypothetical protein